MSRQPGTCVSGSLPLPNVTPRVTPQLPGGDNRSEGSVCDPVTRYRLSILAFDDTAGLAHAVGDLIGHGMEPGQLGVIARPHSLDALMVPGGLDPDIKRNILNLLAAPSLPLRLDDAADLVVRGGPGIRALLKQPQQDVGAFDWMQDERREDLARHAANGAVILLVSAATAEQHATSAGVLLRHGRHNLQTHVFTRPKTR